MSNRLVKRNEFYEILNERVFKPNLGHELKLSEIHDLVHGISDTVFEIVHEGNHVRFGGLGTFRAHVTPAGPRWDPSKKKSFDGPERRKLAFKQSKGTKNLMGV